MPWPVVGRTGDRTRAREARDKEIEAELRRLTLGFTEAIAQPPPVALFRVSTLLAMTTAASSATRTSELLKIHLSNSQRP